jgi:hypothetical protein
MATYGERIYDVDYEITEKKVADVQVGDLLYNGNWTVNPILAVERPTPHTVELTYHDRFGNVTTFPHYDDEINNPFYVFQPLPDECPIDEIEPLNDDEITPADECPISDEPEEITWINGTRISSADLANFEECNPEGARYEHGTLIQLVEEEIR